MFRIKSRYGYINHKCVQCGCTAQYGGINFSYCPVCKAVQKVRFLDTKTTFPVAFLVDEVVWRMAYHMSKESNCDYRPEAYSNEDSDS